MVLASRLLLISLGVCASVKSTPISETLNLDADAYEVVLMDLSLRSGAHSLPIVVDPQVYIGTCTPYCESPLGDQHSSELMDELISRGAISVACPPGQLGGLCYEREERISIRLSPIMELGPGATVKIVPDTAGVPLGRLLDGIPDDQAVPADLAIDAVITTPCPESRLAERCRLPDTVAYRYFVRVLDGRIAQLVTRWPIGAV